MEVDAGTLRLDRDDGEERGQPASMKDDAGERRG